MQVKDIFELLKIDKYDLNEVRRIYNGYALINQVKFKQIKTILSALDNIDFNQDNCIYGYLGNFDIRLRPNEDEAGFWDMYVSKVESEVAVWD